MRVIVDGRWVGIYGIQRFAAEVLKRVPANVELLRLSSGPGPSSPLSPFWLAAQVARAGRGVVFSPGYMPPAWCRNPFVFTMHDLIPIQAPARLSSLKHLFYNRVVRPAALRAARILTVSQYSAQQIVQWLGTDPSKVAVIGNGVDPYFCPSDTPPARPEVRYILYVGGQKPHKNISRLLQAWQMASLADVTLRLSGPPVESLEREAQMLGLRSRVAFTGPLSDSELREQYRGALALVMPSLYEGFGLPVAEAMACGTPVIASNVTSLPEVVGPAGVLVNPCDVESIAEGICRVVSDPALRRELRQKGLERAKCFSWDRTAKLAWDRVQEAG